MSNLKEMIIRTMPNGKETLNEIKVLKKTGYDYSLEKGKVEKTINRLHRDNLKLIVSEIRNINENAKTFRLITKNEYLPVFQSGQYINLFVEIDGVRTSRPYSICSSNKQRAYYEITVARIQNGFVSDYFLDKVKVGDEFEANGPAGVFHFNPAFHNKNNVYIAGGSGITPFISMIKEVTESGLDRNIHLIYGCRDEDNILFKEELERIQNKHSNFKFSVILSEPKQTYKGLKGFIDEKCIKNLIKDIKNKTYYICGPQIMNDFVVNELEKMNIKKSMIRREMFGSRQDIQNEPGWPKNLSGNETFKIKINDKKEIEAFSKDSLLTTLEKNGIRVNVCCRSGECSLCRVQLKKGKVFMPRGVLLRHADEKFGYIHSCKAYPITDIEICI